MATFLLTWNPKRSGDEYVAEILGDVQSRGIHRGDWSCGLSRRIYEGDRIFLLRQGVEPRGIVAAGRVTSEEPYWRAHWDGARGHKARYVEVDFTTAVDLHDPGPLRLARLRDGALGEVHWSTSVSGISVAPAAAILLEQRWTAWLARHATGPVVMPGEIASAGSYFEGATRKVRVNAYERDRRPRDACVQHYGARCSVCGFDFGHFYGSIGQGFIHVHHLRSLGEIGMQYRVDPIKDLRPVCPNCHAMLHRGEKPPSVAGLKRQIKNLSSR